MAARKERDEDEKEPKAKELPDPPDRGGDDDPIEVEVSERDDDEEEVEVDEQERPSRAEKKRQRGNAFREAQERAAAAEAERDRMRSEYAAWQQSVQAQQVQQHSQQQVGHAEQRLHDDLKTFYGALEGAKRPDGSLPPEQVADFERRARELEERKFQVYAAKHNLGQQVDPRQIAAHVEQVQLQAKYADIFANPAAKNWGEGRLLSLAAERGLNAQNITRPQYYELLEEAADETRQRFGLGNRRRAPTPDAATRARHTGIPARSNGGTGETIKVAMGRDQKRMAEARYPEDSPETAWKKWANGPGKRAMLAMQQKSR